MPTDPAKVANFDFGEHSLRSAPDLTNGDRAQLYDLFHSSDSPENLRAQLVDYPHVPDHVKELLVEDRARQDKIGSGQQQQSEAPKDTLGRAIDALKDLHQLAQVDPKALEFAVRNPSLAKSFIDAVVRHDDAGKV